jgi:5-methylcytosine-specific restriction enzyme A
MVGSATRHRIMRSDKQIRKIYSSSTWRRVSKRVLERDGYQCQIGGDKCLGKATQADHVVPLSLDGLAYEMTNLRAVCQPCHSARRKSVSNAPASYVVDRLRMLGMHDAADLAEKHLAADDSPSRDW